MAPRPGQAERHGRGRRRLQLPARPLPRRFARRPAHGALADDTRPQPGPRPRVRQVALQDPAAAARPGSQFPSARVTPVLHHRAHQLTAFAASGWRQSRRARGRQPRRAADHHHRPRPRHPAPRLQPLEAINDPASLGYVYGAVTEHLGWRRGDEEGTVMALAALGDPARFRHLFTTAVRTTATGFRIHPCYFPARTLTSGYPRTSRRFVAETCPERHPSEPLTDVHRDLAAALQERTEQVMVHLARRARALTGSRRLCVGGGVATNCVSIGKIIEAGIFDEVFVPPAPGTLEPRSGPPSPCTSMGAALARSRASPATVTSAPLTRTSRST
ncbi:carbamoyltransferase N-terminal domain-containing protein [Streptomyces sp. KL116D]|uniref:carbamoyltransferase N-terminal domain-containing protein n=1 Tax=Streptomyces sp. KL116D TaxID=3045152 RepID=UPI0035582BB8